MHSHAISLPNNRPLRGAARCLAAACLGLVVAAASAMAAPVPPARVGRLSYISGDVQQYSDAQGAWASANLNLPITSQATLWSGDGARAEVAIGSADVRLDGHTQADFTRLDDAGVDLVVTDGSVEAHLRRLVPGDRWLIVAQGSTMRPSRAGTYRIDVDPATHQVTAKVLAGVAELRIGDTTLSLASGQQATLDTTARTVASRSTLLRSAFDDWSTARDRALTYSAAAQFLPPEMTGMDTLDAYGSWSEDSSYGAVWVPSVTVADWAPYRYGRWDWVAPWGYTWIDDAPWGFAPFHYGRWTLIGARWAWVPGALVAHPVYAPALVGFYGAGGADGAGVSFGLTFGGTASAGWFPLGPDEVYRPNYTSDLRYLRAVNLSSVARATSITAQSALPISSYRYAREVSAATVVAARALQSGMHVASARMQVTAPQLAGASVAAGAAPALRARRNAALMAGPASNHLPPPRPIEVWPRRASSPEAMSPPVQHRPEPREPFEPEREGGRRRER